MNRPNHSWTPFRCLALSFLTLVFFLPGILHSQPLPAGWSWPSELNSWSFSDTNTWQSDRGDLPVSFTNVSASEMGDIGNGYSLHLNGTNAAWLQFAVSETNGATNLTVNVGTVIAWFAPDWASASSNQGGNGPGTLGRLIEVGAYTTNADLGWWSIYLDGGGTNVYFSAQTNSGDGAVAFYLSAPIDWATNQWHMIALAYSSTNSACTTMYKFLYRGSTFANQPRAHEFLGRWLDKVGGTRTLTKTEMTDLLADSKVAESIGQQLHKKPHPDVCTLTDETLNEITAAAGTDWFHALGWFQVRFTGQYCRRDKTVALDGTFAMSDLYDWQKPGNKYVIIAGDAIYDKWATLVEDQGLATPFQVRGSAQLQLKVPY